MLGYAVINALPVTARNYEKMWKEVVVFQQKDLPQSALKSVRQIFNKAMDDNNKGEMLKAYLFMLQLKGSISVDSIQPDMKRLEQMTSMSRDSVEKAVMHSLLGSLYAGQQYNGKNDNLSVSGFPEDMGEWTRAMYRKKAGIHFTASLSHKAMLAHASMENYLPVIVKGNTDQYLGNDLLHVVGQTTVNNLNDRNDSTLIHDFYDSMIHYYAGEGNRNATVLVTLNKLDYDYSNGFIDNTGYIRTVKQLITDNPQAETCIEAYIALAGKNRLWQHDRASQLAFIRKGLKAFPKYNRIDALKEIEANVLAPYLRADVQRTGEILPGKPVKMALNWSNLDKTTIEFYRIKDGYSKDLQKEFNAFINSFSASHKKGDDFLKRYTNGKAAYAQTYDLKGKPYELNDTTLYTPAPAAGIYVVRLSADGAEENANNYILMAVSHLRAIIRNGRENGKSCTEFQIVDAISGRPVPEASIALYDDKGNETARLKAGIDGLVRIDTERGFNYRLIAPEDNYSLPEHGGNSNYSPLKETTSHAISLYTDRNVYRPGQLVKVAGIAYKKSLDKSEVEANKTITVKLTDANRKQVGEKKVITNEYGSFSTEFVLPSSTLNGMFILSAPEGKTLFRVEDYKRPTFEVTFDNPAKGYKAGDSLTVIGTARTYAGVPLQHARVDYTISVRNGYWRNGNTNLPQQTAGSATTDEEGHFIIPMRLMRLPENGTGDWFYNYDVNARVLSPAGETQEGSLTLPLSNRSLYVRISGISDQSNVLKDGLKPVTIQVLNLKNEPVNCKGSYALIPIKEGKMQGKCLLKPFTAGKTFIDQDIKDLASGSYRLIARIKDETGEVVDTTNFVLYSEQDVHPPVKTDFWHEVISDEISDKYPAAPSFVQTSGNRKKNTSGWVYRDDTLQKSAVIQVGSSLKDVYLFYRLYNGDKCIEDRKILLSDSILTFKYDYKPEYKKGLRATFAFLKDGRLYSSNDNITFVEPDKTLSLAWDTFRDKLVPGQKENWTMWIARNDRKPFDGAELLASMYDASLDGIFKGGTWRPIQAFRSSYRNGGLNPYPYMSNSYSWLSMYAMWPDTGKFNYRPLTYSRLTTGFYDEVSVQDEMPVQLLSSGVRQNLAMSRFSTRGTLRENKVAGFAAPTVAMDSMEKVFHSVSSSDNSADQRMEKLFSHQLPRSNFNETAFFYPHLQADKAGKVSISFTLPDALTKWRFRTIAHTKDMLNDVKDTTVTVSKDFMVQPNLPRYVRAGDTVSFPVTVANLSAKDLSGIARMELLDQDTQQIIYTESQRFTLTAGKNYGLNFKWKAEDKYPAIVCKIQAVSGKVADGEQNYVLVLNNREPVTESIPLSADSTGTVTYNLKSLFQKNNPLAENRRLSIEFTSNPVWYAVQSLPAMAEGQEEDALSLSSAFYAKTLAQYIAGRYPGLKNVFDSWKRDGGTSESLWSNLQKNQELKTILLDETPWVAEAASETERKQRLATLFDINAMTYSMETTLDKLQDLQGEDGGWSWYKGMSSNEFTTLTIAEQLARLEKLTGKQSAAHSLLEKAETYLMKEVRHRYEQLKKEKKVYDTSSLVIRTYYLQSLSGKLKEEACTRFFLDGWEKNMAGLSNEDKARCIIIMNAAGRTSAAKILLNSLLEHTVHSNEMGRYFDTTPTNRLFYSVSGRIPVQILAVEALKESGNHPQETEDMMKWLLKQKQTQLWGNAVQSADTNYALLIGYATNTLEHKMPAILEINGKRVETDKDMAVLGYIHNSYDSGSIVDSLSTLAIIKNTRGIAWGGVYAQYTLPLDKITSSAAVNTRNGQSLNIRRELYIERTENGKNVRFPINKVVAQVGDKLVSRLIVKADRDMDFVQIKDGRAACAEPVEVLSGYYPGDGIGYYQSTKDASTNYYCDRMKKGTYIFENTSYIDRAGRYTSGMATVQCAYAPEFISRANPETINVK